MKQTIAIDIDDVLADSTDALRISVNQKLGTNLQPHHYKVDGPYWHYYEHIWETHSINDKIEHNALEAQMEYDQSHIMPISGAQEALTYLSKKYEIVLITARNPDWAKATEEWMHSHFSGVFKSLHLVGSKKYQGDSARTKGEVCKELGASWLIDDNPEHCLSAIEYGSDAVLFGEYGWHLDAPDHLIRCKDWPAVLEYFDNTTS